MNLPAYNPNQVDEKLVRLQEVARKYEIAGGSIVKLRNLDKYDIVIICDDSSSMNAAAQKVTSAFQQPRTRWQELCERVQEIVEIATCVDSDGIDLYFLNSDPVKNVTSPDVVRDIFYKSKRPNGYTPLTACYEHVLKDKNIDERPLLILVATDGEPNSQGYDGHWKRDVDGFIRTITKRKNPERCPTCILACTDDSSEVSWMNKLDSAPFVDILDDYLSEKKEVQEKQGKDFHYTEGDYMVNALLGPVDPIYDQLDEKRLSTKQYAEYMGEKGRVARPKQCCIIS
jgi:hypothetical protein